MDELERMIGVWTHPDESSTLLLVIDKVEHLGKRTGICGLIHPYPLDDPKAIDLLKIDSALKDKLASTVIGPRKPDTGLCVMSCGFLRLDTRDIFGRMYFDPCYYGELYLEDVVGWAYRLEPETLTFFPTCDSLAPFKTYRRRQPSHH